jgi:UDP-glucuronate decarboxylase
MIGNKPKVLIAGGAGFIGFNLTKKLLSSGNFQIMIIDNFLTSQRANIDELRKYGDFKFIESNIEDLKPDFDVDHIYNLACPASPIHYQKYPIETWKASTFGVFSLLEITKKNKARFLQTSTSEIYGDPLVYPQNEEYWGNVNPIGVRSCYDEGKRAAETLIQDYRRTFDLDTKIVRLFNTFGPYMHPNDGRVVSNFIMSALKNEPIQIYGDGSSTRSFCYIDELVDGLISAMNIQFEGPINLGTTNEISILDLAKLIISKTNSQSLIEFLPAKPDDPIKRKPDLTRAENILKWKSNITLEDGLEKTIKHFQQML